MSKKYGYTLVELLIVIVIISILTGASIVGYQNYNDRQTLKQGASDFVNILRSAQQKVLNGEKLYPFCQYSILQNWHVTRTSLTRYQIEGLCDTTNFGIIQYNLSSGLQFNNAYATSVSFLTLGQGIQGGSPVTFRIENTNLNKYIDITISGSGEITQSAILP